MLFRNPVYPSMSNTHLYIFEEAQSPMYYVQAIAKLLKPKLIGMMFH